MWLPAAAAPAKDLGRAYAAYERGDLAASKQALAKISETAIKNRDYLFWLRGMVALRLGDAAAARRAFEQLAKQTKAPRRRTPSSQPPTVRATSATSGPGCFASPS